MKFLIAFVGVCISLFALCQDTIAFKAKLLYLDMVSCEASHHFPDVEKRLLVRVIEKLDSFCKSDVVLHWQTGCECSLKGGKTYIFKVVKVKAANEGLPEEIRNARTVDFCPSYVLHKHSEYNYWIIEIDGIDWRKSGSRPKKFCSRG